MRVAAVIQLSFCLKRLGLAYLSLSFRVTGYLCGTRVDERAIYLINFAVAL